jgi:antirestriction protein ArdC
LLQSLFLLIAFWRATKGNAAFLCADLEPQIREDYVPSMAGWLKVLKADSKATFTATYAQQAADFPNGRQTLIREAVPF